MSREVAASPDCEPRELARSALGNVCRCAGCGNVQLTLQCLTLRLEPDAFRDLVALVSDAAFRLDGDAPLH